MKLHVKLQYNVTVVVRWHKPWHGQEMERNHARAQPHAQPSPSPTPPTSHWPFRTDEGDLFMTENERKREREGERKGVGVCGYGAASVGWGRDVWWFCHSPFRTRPPATPSLLPCTTRYWLILAILPFGHLARNPICRVAEFDTSIRQLHAGEEVRVVGSSRGTRGCLG